MMGAKYILAAVSAIFLVLAATRLARGAGIGHPQTRAWLLVGVIFALVSVFLFLRQG